MDAAHIETGNNANVIMAVPIITPTKGMTIRLAKMAINDNLPK